MPTLKEQRDAASRRQLLAWAAEQEGCIGLVQMDDLRLHCQVGERPCLESVSRVLAGCDAQLRRRPSKGYIVVRPTVSFSDLRRMLREGEESCRAPRTGRGGYRDYLVAQIRLSEEIGRCVARRRDRIMMQKMAYHTAVLRGLLEETDRELELLGEN